ncbi:unnamed protein product, partial [Staurois parvus]
MVSGKNAPNIGGQWEECPLHWRSVGRMFLTLAVSGKNAITLAVSGKNAPYIGGQWEECPLDWRSVGRMSLTLAVSGKNAITL